MLLRKELLINRSEGAPDWSFRRQGGLHWSFGTSGFWIRAGVPNQLQMLRSSNLWILRQNWKIFIMTRRASVLIRIFIRKEGYQHSPFAEKKFAYIQNPDVPEGGLPPNSSLRYTQDPGAPTPATPQSPSSSFCYTTTPEP